MTFMNLDNRRLVIRYHGERINSFNFTKVRLDATDQGMYDAANAFASIQEHQPRRISTVITRQLMM